MKMKMFISMHLKFNFFFVIYVILKLVAKIYMFINVLLRKEN